MTTNVPNEHPPELERRPNRRRHVLFTGIVASRDGTRSFDCAIRNLSDGGAKITFGATDQLPQACFLINVRDRLVYDAKIVWRTGKAAGLSFEKTMRFSDINDPSLSFLADLWLAKANSGLSMAR